MEIPVAGQPAYLYTGGKTPSYADFAEQPLTVFIHGAQQDHTCWALQSRWFAHHGCVVAAPDLPGHGRSAGNPLASVEASADWIAALLDALGAARAFLVGHSMGALVALETALRHPARVERLALLGAALPMPVADMLLAAARDNEPKAIALVNAWSYSAAGQIGGNTVPGLCLLGMNRRLMERQKPGVFHADLSACNAYLRTLENLTAIACPTCVIAGDADRMTPLKANRALAAAIPGASLAVIPGSGHALMAERPDAVLDVLRDFAVQR